MEIKFRGRTPAGELVYGDLTHWRGNVFIGERRVISASVAQLIGYDRTDAEIYEGDRLTDRDGFEYEARQAGWLEGDEWSGELAPENDLILKK